ncbi:GntR family transcriptional regulator [Nocardia sp. NPDC003963]
MSAFVPEQTSLTDQVYGELLRAIQAGELPAGTLHSVVELSAKLGVSRTPVREAFQRMASSGLVKFERSRGVRILEISTRDIEEIYSLRMLLEVPSAHRAAARMTPALLQPVEEAFAAMKRATEAGSEPDFQQADIAFHAAILHAAGNGRVVDVTANTRMQMLDRGLSTTRTRTLDDILIVHERILTALRNSDPAGSAGTMRDHLVETTQLLIAQSTGDQDLADAYQPPPLPIAGAY